MEIIQGKLLLLLPWPKSLGGSPVSIPSESYGQLNAISDMTNYYVQTNSKLEY